VRIASIGNTFTSIHRARRAALWITSSIALAMMTACGNDGTAPLVPASIAIGAPSATTSAEGTIQFSATVKDANGQTINVAPTWTVVNGGGTITSGGLFTAGDSVGTFVNTVVATSGAATSSSTVTVTAGGLASITVTADTGSLAIGATRQFVVVGKDAHGNVVDVPGRVWSVAHGGGGIDTAGVFTADTTAGIFANTVTATSGSITGTASVTVSPDPLETITVSPSTDSLVVGGQQTFTAVGHDSYNNVVAITPTWLVVGGGGTIDGSGVFTAGTTAGTFTNTVMARQGSGCGAINGRATVAVLPGALTTITVSPANPTLLVGGTQQFTAAGTDTYGNAIAITPTWEVIGPGGGSINATTGLYTAGGLPGTYTNSVAAFVNTLVGVTTVTIMPPPPPPPIIIIPSD
jgi:hypothetical protein